MNEHILVLAPNYLMLTDWCKRHNVNPKYVHLATKPEDVRGRHDYTLLIIEGYWEALERSERSKQEKVMTAAIAMRDAAQTMLSSRMRPLTDREGRVREWVPIQKAEHS